MKILKTLIFLLLPLMVSAQFIRPIKSFAGKQYGQMFEYKSPGKIETAFGSKYHIIRVGEELEVKIDPTNMVNVLHDAPGDGTIWDYYRHDDAIVLVLQDGMDVSIFLYNFHSDVGFAVSTLKIDDWKGVTRDVFDNFLKYIGE